MNILRTTKLTGLLALAAVVVAAQDPVLLRRELKAGTTETYKIESVIKQDVEAPTGAQDMIITTVGTVTLKTGVVDSAKGTAAVTATTKIDKMAIDGSLAAMLGAGNEKLPDPKTETGTLDTNNRFKVAVDPKAKPAGANAMLGLPTAESMSSATMLALIELPDKAIKAGDVFEVALPGSAGAATMGVKDLKMKVTYVGEKDTDAGRVWTISYSGDMKLNVDTSKMPKQQGQADNPMGDVTITGALHVTGDGIIEKATGKTLSNVMKIGSDIKAVLQSMGLEVPIKGLITIKTELTK